MLWGSLMNLREPYLHDYLALAFVGFLFGVFVSGAAGVLKGNWPSFVAVFLVVGFFIIIPGGFVVAYLSFRLFRVGENLQMEGLKAGVFTAFVYAVISFFLALAGIIADSKSAVDIMVAWILGVLFAFMLYSLGGYLGGLLERRPFAMPGIFDLSRISRVPSPPPPPSAEANVCPTCGQPLTFVQQYNRWYCPNCKKYP
jgi:predicted lysophospholipase L1 biosynthesis ABC-type transport system permease subunit